MLQQCLESPSLLLRTSLADLHAMSHSRPIPLACTGMKRRSSEPRGLVSTSSFRVRSAYAKVKELTRRNSGFSANSGGSLDDLQSLASSSLAPLDSAERGGSNGSNGSRSNGSRRKRSGEFGGSSGHSGSGRASGGPYDYADGEVLS